MNDSTPGKCPICTEPLTQKGTLLSCTDHFSIQESIFLAAWKKYDSSAQDPQAAEALLKKLKEHNLIQSKSLSQLNRNDKAVISQLLQWKGKNLRDCSKGELIECIVHLSAQLVVAQKRLDKVEILPTGQHVLVEGESHDPVAQEPISKA